MARQGETSKARAGLQRLDSLRSKVTGRRRIFIATWRTGHNFGDDYIAEAMEFAVRSNVSTAKVVHTNFHLDSYRTNRDDLLIVGGGGFWGTRGDGRLDDALYSAWMSARCPLVIANMSFESFAPASGERLKSLVRKAKLFTVRDRESWNWARDVVSDEQVFWTADTSYLNPLRVERNPVRHRIGFNLCSPAVAQILPLESSVTIAEAVTNLRDLGYDLRGVALRAGGQSPDHVFCRKVDPSCPEEFTPAVYRDSEFFVGMRFHSLLLALQNLIPAIAIVCSAKVKRLMEEYELEDYSLDPRDAKFQEKLANLIENADSDTIIDTIREGNRRAEARLKPFKDRLSSLLQRAQ